MNRVLLLVLMSLFAMASMAQTKDYVEVMYFHGKQRCATCKAIEAQAREVVDNTFAAEKKNGKVVFKIVDISTAEGAKIAKDYRVSWSSLFVNAWRGGKETRNDLTQFAFKNARNNIDEFKKGVSGKINELLK